MNNNDIFDSKEIAMLHLACMAAMPSYERTIDNMEGAEQVKLTKQQSGQLIDALIRLFGCDGANDPIDNLQVAIADKKARANKRISKLQETINEITGVVRDLSFIEIILNRVLSQDDDDKTKYREV